MNCGVVRLLLSSLLMAKKRPIRNPERSKDVPVTQGMLFGVRDQLSEQIKAESRRFDSQFHELKSEFHELKSEFHGVKSEIHGMKSELHRVAILVEEQNARNAIVLDGLTSLFTRQDRVETEVSDLKKYLNARK